MTSLFKKTLWLKDLPNQEKKFFKLRGRPIVISVWQKLNLITKIMKHFQDTFPTALGYWELTVREFVQNIKEN